MIMKKHVDITIRGLVQGVTFRFSARVYAESIGICGYAKNEPDGSVRIEAEGDEENLKRFINWCAIGPDGAHVDKVDVALSDALKDYGSFESIRTKSSETA
jgi:acylphosphatase